MTINFSYLDKYKRNYSILDFQRVNFYGKKWLGLRMARRFTVDFEVRRGFLETAQFLYIAHISRRLK